MDLSKTANKWIENQRMNEKLGFLSPSLSFSAMQAMIQTDLEEDLKIFFFACFLEFSLISQPISKLDDRFPKINVSIDETKAKGREQGNAPRFKRELHESPRACQGESDSN